MTLCTELKFFFGVATKSKVVSQRVCGCRGLALLEGGAREGAMHSRPQKPAPLALPQLLVPFARSSSILVIWYASSASTLGAVCKKF